MKEYRNSLLFHIVFCLFIAGLAVYDMASSYAREEANAHGRVANSCLMIGEWLKGEFKSNDYVLRDIVSNVPLRDLQYPNPDPVRQAEITAFIRSKLDSLPESVTGIGLVNRDCISTHTYNRPPRPSIIGLNGSTREWCQRPENDSKLDAFITQTYLANTNQMTVNQLRRFHGHSPEGFDGLAVLSIELPFFSTWLEQVAIGPHGILSITDTSRHLLARNPVIPEATGHVVNDRMIEAFIASQDRHISYSGRSPLDGEMRIYGALKLDNLPFIVIVGEAYQDFLASWRQRVWGVLIALVIFWGMSCLILRNYRLRLRERDYIRSQEEMFAKAFHSAPYALTLTRMSDSQIFMVNESFEKITGYLASEVTDKTTVDLHLWDDETDRLRIVEELSSKGRVREKEIPFRNRNGERIIGLFFAEVLYINSEPCILSSINDITGRKKAEEALRKSEIRYRDLSIIDDLTNLYNSRHFQNQLTREIIRANRYGQPLTLLLLDLDNFKQVNDTYGHIMGDKVLSRLGHVVARCLRQSDSAYRYGGEEFTILLPMTNKQNGFVTAERIRTEFRNEIFTPPTEADESFHVTLSIGVAQYRPQEELSAFVHRVDTFMYEAKARGKDTVCCEE